MDDYSLHSLTESKNEWCARLVNVLTPTIIDGFKSIFQEAWTLCKDNEEIDKYLLTFQTFLARIPKWNNTIIEEETTRIINTSNCGYLEDLISCVHIIHLKALTCIRVGQKKKKISLDIPPLGKFIHNVYVSVARKIYTNIYLFERNISALQTQRHNRELELIIKECILNTIRDSIAIESILRAYMDETTEEEVQVKEELIDVVDTTVNNASTETASSPVKSPSSSVGVTTSSVVDSPSSVETTSSSAETTSSSAKATSSSAEATSSSAKATSSSAEATSSSVETTPSPVEITPSSMEATSSSVKTTPSSIEIPSSSIATTTSTEKTPLSVEVTPSSTESTLSSTKIITPSIRNDTVSTKDSNVSLDTVSTKDSDVSLDTVTDIKKDDDKHNIVFSNTSQAQTTGGDIVTIPTETNDGDSSYMTNNDDDETLKIGESVNLNINDINDVSKDSIKLMSPELTDVEILA